MSVETVYDLVFSGNYRELIWLAFVLTSVFVIFRVQASSKKRTEGCRHERKDSHYR